MRFEFVELIESLVASAEQIGQKEPSVLVITKAGKYLRGHIKDHNVRINSDGRVRGRLVFSVEGADREIDANDVSSLENLKK